MKQQFNTDWQFLESDNWINVTLPHTPKIEAYDVGIHFQGKSHYRKHFTLNRADLDKRLVIEFEAVMQYCEIRVNGGEPVVHYGGYLPIYVDLTGKAREENVIEVMADNSDMPDVPPGKPLDVLDFGYFGGIYRNVWLHITDRAHITLPVQKGITAGGGIFVTYPEVTGERALVNVKVNVENGGSDAEDLTVKCELMHKGTNTASADLSAVVDAGQNKDFVYELAVDSPHLWTPDDPQLYDLTVSLCRGASVIERKTVRVGIRTVAVKEGKFLLNGRHIKLYGTNRHQSFPYVGNAAGDRAHYRDACLMKEMGVNFIRLAHYPQSESFISACDELGIMLCEPVPGWQWFRNTEQFRRIGIENAREMVLRDRNHPSIIFWEATLNESHNTPNEYCREVVNAIKAEYPGDQCLCSGDTINKDAEFIGLDISHPSPYKYIPGHEDKPGDAPAYNGVQYYREYGDWDFGGNESTSRKGREDGDIAMLLACWNQWHMYAHIFNKAEIIGLASWVGIDYNRGYCPQYPICRCGALDSLRRKKFQFEMMRSQGSREPMVFIANYWESEEKTRKLVVFSNCEEVELFVNGRAAARRKPESGRPSDYKIKGLESDPYYWMDGTDARELAEKKDFVDPLEPYSENLMWNGDDAEGTLHPYFVFDGVPYEKGSVEAVGYIGGIEAARHSVSSCGEPARIAITPDDKYAPLKADGNDFIFVDADILDADGNLVYNFTGTVEFGVTGGTVIGPAVVSAIAGKATIMLKADADVSLTARCGDMAASAVIVTEK